MTLQSEVINNQNYVPLLDHGFLGRVESMGNDETIVQSARVSYGSGTKSVSEDRGLIRYLMRHSHTSPFEMCEVRFHAKVPVFVMRQLVRHRLANLNEYSGRYSIMSDEFYLPEPAQIAPQSATNKQGRAGEIDETSKQGVRWLMETAYQHSASIYKLLLGEHGDDSLYDLYEVAPLLPDEFPGVAREMARAVLPVANYTELYWKCDLSNIFKLLKLRRDSHAQYEIRVFADAMFSLIQPVVPLACEAFEDYMMEAATLSRMELNLMRDMLHRRADFETFQASHGGEKELAQEYGLSMRELRDLRGLLAA